MLSKDKQKRILFKVSGSFEVGFGHIKRSITLINEIVKYSHIENVVIFCDSPEEIVIDFLGPYKFFLNYKDDPKIIDYIGMHNVNILVIDEPRENIELCKALKKLMPKVVVICLDYFNYDNPFVNIIINLFNHNTVINDPAERFEGKYYEGLEYAIIRENFTPYIKRKKEIKSAVEKILITYGGVDTSNNTIKSLEFLESLGYNRDVDIVIGPFFRNKKDVLEFIKYKKYTCYIRENINDIEEYIYNADLGFIGSGTTLMEFCAIGTPAIVMPQNDREHRFAKFFEDKAAVKVLNFNKNDITVVDEVINNRELKVRMSEIGKSLIDGKGKERIRSIILEAT